MRLAWSGTDLAEAALMRQTNRWRREINSRPGEEEQEEEIIWRRILEFTGKKKNVIKNKNTPPLPLFSGNL